MMHILPRFRCTVFIEPNSHVIYRGYLFSKVKGRNLFHRVDTIGNIFTICAATSENITDGKFQSFTGKKRQIFCLFHSFDPFWEELYQNPVQFFSVIPHGVPLPHSNAITILRQAQEI